MRRTDVCSSSQACVYSTADLRVTAPKVRSSQDALRRVLDDSKIKLGCTLPSVGGYAPTLAGIPLLSPRVAPSLIRAGSNHGLGTTDINSGAGNPASPGSLEDPLPIIRQAHMSSRSSLLGSL